eukprot:3493865-Alexandrium_andersonii.AAC.1
MGNWHLNRGHLQTQRFNNIEDESFRTTAALAAAPQAASRPREPRPISSRPHPPADTLKALQGSRPPCWHCNFFASVAREGT